MVAPQSSMRHTSMLSKSLAHCGGSPRLVIKPKPWSLNCKEQSSNSDTLTCWSMRVSTKVNCDAARSHAKSKCPSCGMRCIVGGKPVETAEPTEMRTPCLVTSARPSLWGGKQAQHAEPGDKRGPELEPCHIHRQQHRPCTEARPSTWPTESKRWLPRNGPIRVRMAPTRAYTRTMLAQDACGAASLKRNVGRNWGR